MDLPGRGQAAHRFPHPRAGGNRGEKHLDLFTGGRIDGLQIHRHQQRQGRYLGGRRGGRERRAVAQANHLPACRLAAFLGVCRADAHRLPQLAQGAQNGSFRQLAAQAFAGLGGCEHAVLIERLPQFQHQRGDLVTGGFLRGMLPVRIGAQGEHKRQRLAVGEKIRLLAHRAEQIQRYHVAGGDQAGQQALRLLDGGGGRRRMAAPHAGFEERRCRRRQLRGPRQEET
jgi:hypothetical protein